jgi:hypothetical protein
MNDNDMAGGLYPKPKHPNAPDFVIGKLSINVEQFREWFKAYLQANPGTEWVNLDMKVSKAGKGYAVVDTWKPEQQAPSGGGSVDDDIPFAPWMKGEF